MIIRKYKELKFYIEMFRNGNADLLIIEGRGGTGKSKIVNEIMRNTQHLRIGGHTTPMKLYMLGYKFKNFPLIFDDVDSLLHNKRNVSLLKMFCETENEKQINWFTTNKLLQDQGVPSRYVTKSKVAIVCNDFKTITKKIGALKDRGWHLEFKPTDQEILRKMKKIKGKIKNGLDSSEKKEVLNLIERYSKFSNFTLRTFIKGMQLYKECKDRGKDWKKKLLKSMEVNQKLVEVNKLIENYKSDKERLEKWPHSRRSFYEYKKKLVQKCKPIPKTSA